MDHMSYTPQQEQQAQQLMMGIEDYLTQLINYNGNNFPKGLDLAHNPEWMDRLVNYYRTKDACLAYLIAPGVRDLPVNLESHSSAEIDQFFNIHDPQDVADFFNQDNIIHDYTMVNEFDQPDAFKNDPKFDQQYHQFFISGSIGQP